ncbi:MAG: META domain-containing protein [Actinomycetota bacterium]
MNDRSTPEPLDDPVVVAAFDRLRADVQAVSTDAARHRMDAAAGRRALWGPMLVGAAAVVLVALGIFALREDHDPELATDAAEDDASPVPAIDASEDDATTEDETSGSSSDGPNAETLEGTSWVLASGVGPGGPVPLIDTFPVTMSFGRRADGASTISGRAACNGYEGDYRLDAETGTFAINEYGKESAGCGAAIEASETAFLAALGSVNRLELRDERLILSGPDGVELRFLRQPPVPIDDIVGRTWLLVSLMSGEVTTEALGEPATLRLEPDGAVVGGTGCRSLNGEWVVAGASIQFPIWRVDGACSPELVDQNGHVVNVLGDGFAAVVEGDTLRLSSAGDEGLVYRLLDDEPAPSTVPATAEEAIEQPGDLRGTAWRLVSLMVGGEEIALRADHVQTLEFAAAVGDAVALDLLCGRSEWMFAIDGSTLSVGRSTFVEERDCDAGGGLELEQVFMALLDADNGTITVDPDGSLVIAGDDSELRFLPLVTEVFEVGRIGDAPDDVFFNVVGYPTRSNDGGWILCERAPTEPGRCGGPTRVLLRYEGSGGAREDLVVSVDWVGRLFAAPGWEVGRRVLGSFEGYEVVPPEYDMMEALAQGRLDDDAIVYHPDGVALSLGGIHTVAARTPAELRSVDGWMLDAEPFRGADARTWNLLERLAATFEQSNIYAGPHMHCAGPPMALPPVEFARQTVIEATGFDSCLQWGVVDVLFDDDRRIVAINVDWWEP